MKFYVALCTLVSLISGYTRNQSISEWGISLTYNTHLENWDIDTPDSGTPVFNGYFFILGTNDLINPDYNETLGEEPIRKHPKWTKENSMRVCMTFWSSTTGVENREHIRWVLEYKPPKYFASFTPQMPNTTWANVTVTEIFNADVRLFCAENSTYLEQPDMGDEEDSDSGDRRLQS